MASSSRRLHSEDSPDLSPHYNQILLASPISRVAARQSSARNKVTLVGSGASDVRTTGSDVDMLIEPRDITINESILIYHEHLPCYVRVSSEGLTGLVPQLLLGEGGYMRADTVRDMAEEIFGEADRKFDQSSKVGKICNTPGIDIDFVPQLRVSGLPRTAHSFTTRDRLWPPYDIISLVSGGEFHLAARPAPSNPDPEHDFCLSFAKAEVVLLRTMSANQRLSIRYLKIIGHLIGCDQGVLTSYHLKTSALWYFEKTDAGTWEKNCLVVDILKGLDQYLNDRFLPHYFVSEMNLFAGFSKSDLIDVRRRLWYFLGLCLIAGDIEEIRSYTVLNRPMNIITVMNNRISKPNPEKDYMCDIEKIVGLSEVMYGTGNAFNNVTKQKISESVMNLYPLYVVRRTYGDTLKFLFTSINNVVDSYVFSKPMRSTIDKVVGVMRITLNSTKEPFEEFFGMRSAQNVRGSSHGVGIELRKSEQTMNTWLAFTDDLINRLKSQLSKLNDKVLCVMSQESCDYSSVCSDQCKEIDTLFDEVTKDLLSFAVGYIETFAYPVDNDTYSLGPIPGDDVLVNITILHELIDGLFLPVEYAIVMRVRLKASGGSGDQATRIKGMMNPESLEYRCYAAHMVVKGVTDTFVYFYCKFIEYQGFMEFVVNTLRGRDQRHCSQT